MRLAWLILDAVGFAASATFVVMYATGSRGWHHSPFGRNIMAMAACLALLLGMVLVQLVFRPPRVMWLVGLAALDVVMWWRVYLLWQAQHDDEAEPEPVPPVRM